MAGSFYLPDESLQKKKDLNYESINIKLASSHHLTLNFELSILPLYQLKYDVGGRKYT
jgi:hypothetical protein